MSSSSKSLLALACLAALCGNAHAQSSVTLYGLVDVSAGSFQTAGNAKTKAVENGKMTTSYIGFRGIEDLGGGLSAKFTLESFLRADVGASGRSATDPFWARTASVGLAHAQVGTLTLGRNTTTMFVSSLGYNPFGDSFGFSPTIRQYFTDAARGGLYGDSGWSNSAMYVSPTWSGLSVTATVAAGEGAAGATGKNWSTGLKYAVGGFSSMLVFQEVKNGVASIPAGFEKQRAAQGNVSYDFKVAKLFGQYGKVKTDATADIDTSIFQVGTSVPVGPGAFLLSYGESKSEIGTAAATKRKTTSLGYDYKPSKRTDLYLVYMNDKLTAKNDGNTVAVGMRTRF